MKNIKELFSSYLALYLEKQNEPIETYLALWQCLSLISQINSNKHSTKNKTDKDKLNDLFKDYAKDILESLKDTKVILKIKNILSFTNSECPILITKFEDLGEYIDNINELSDLQSELTKLKAYAKSNFNFIGHTNIHDTNIENTTEQKSYKRIKQIEKKLDYFLESLVSLLHLGKNKMFKSIKLDLSDNYAEEGIKNIENFTVGNNNFSDFDIEFSNNAADVLYPIIIGILKP